MEKFKKAKKYSIIIKKGGIWKWAVEKVVS